MRRTRSMLSLFLALTLLLAIFGWRHLAGQRLGQWGLPEDLLDPDHDVTELTLPRSVDRLDWLHGHLRVLDINHSAVSDLSGLPATIEDLNASYTKVRDLSGLPPNLRSLDVTGTRVDNVDHLPSDLQVLKLGSTRVGSIDHLPPRLTELTVDGLTLTDLRSLPANLAVLSLGGSGVESLQGVPASLRSLTLAGTRVKSLKGLPQTLEQLELRGNPELEIDDLPPYLNRLVIDQSTIPEAVTKLRFLTDLKAIHAIPQDASRLPGSLAALRVYDLPASGHSYPPDLRTLGLIGPSLRALKAGDLWRNLETLELDQCLNDTLDYDAPRSLRLLSLPFSQVARLARLPNAEGLLGLDLSGTLLRDLPSLCDRCSLEGELRVLRAAWMKRLERLPALPAQLRILDLRHSPRIVTLPDLPEKLQELWLGGTGITRLPRLPAHLKLLDLRGLRLLDARSRPVHDLRSLADPLPQGLEEIWLAPGQLHTLRGLPRSSRRIKFLSSEIDR
jgi:hypothetical protein